MDINDKPGHDSIRGNGETRTFRIVNLSVRHTNCWGPSQTSPGRDPARPFRARATSADPHVHDIMRRFIFVVFVYLVGNERDALHSACPVSCATPHRIACGHARWRLDRAEICLKHYSVAILRRHDRQICRTINSHERQARFLTLYALCYPHRVTMENNFK